MSMQTEPCAARRDSGLVTIAVVLFVMAIVNIIAMAYVFGLGSRASVGRAQVRMEQARYGAEAGMEIAAVYVSTGGLAPATLTGTVGVARYTVTLVQTNSPDAGRRFAVRSVGTVQGVSRSVSVQCLRSKTWAKYSMWADDNENPANV